MEGGGVGGKGGGYDKKAQVAKIMVKYKLSF